MFMDREEIVVMICFSCHSSATLFGFGYFMIDLFIIKFLRFMKELYGSHKKIVTLVLNPA